MRCVILFLICFVTISNCLIDEEEAESIKNVIFEKRSLMKRSGLPPIVVSNLLNQLGEFYMEKANSRVKVKLVDLIEASKLSTPKCGKEYSKKFDELVELNKAYSLNLIPYLHHYRERQYYLCNKIISEFLEEGSATLSEDDKRNMNLLRKYVSKPSFKAILDYIEKREGALWDIGKEEFDEIFDKDVKGLCKRVNTVLNIKSHLKIKNFFIPEDFASRMKPSTQEWLRSAQICGIYMKNITLLRMQVYDVYQKRKKGFLGRIRNMMTGR